MRDDERTKAIRGRPYFIPIFLNPFVALMVLGGVGILVLLVGVILLIWPRGSDESQTVLESGVWLLTVAVFAYACLSYFWSWMSRYYLKKYYNDDWLELMFEVQGRLHEGFAVGKFTGYNTSATWCLLRSGTAQSLDEVRQAVAISCDHLIFPRTRSNRAKMARLEKMFAHVSEPIWQRRLEDLGGHRAGDRAAL